MARGKTKGAGSFVQVNLRELNRVLKEDAIIVVSRRFAEALVLDTESFVSSTPNQQSAQPVEVNKEELEPLVELEEQEW
tara:strand:+ start:1030 stop:1266 length:237 start_codon:yes stop_codon:yes gene_type:complete